MARHAARGPDNDSWMLDLKEGISKSPSRCTICKVPDWLRITKNDAYSPQIVSIGPLHHRKKNLLAMEESKRYYTLSLLNRTSNEIDALQVCSNAGLDLAMKVPACYDDKASNHIHATELAEMLLVDGCFILELFVRSYLIDAGDDDPILPNPRMISMVMRDLALLENQIPFFVLKELFQVITKYRDLQLPPLVGLALHFFFKEDWLKHEKVLEMDDELFFHLLDLIHKCYSPTSPRIPPRDKGAWKIIQCATKLSDAGIEFDNVPGKNLFDLKFKNGVMKIPSLCIENSLFQNLIAMEQCLRGCEQYMTSYGLLMDYLIDTPKDVELLVQKGIIPYRFGDYEEVSNLFNNICKQAVVRGFYFAGICEDVDKHSKNKCRAYRKSLMRDYCGSPWLIMSLIVAFAILVLTALQTVYSMLAYYHG